MEYCLSLTSTSIVNIKISLKRKYVPLYTHTYTQKAYLYNDLFPKSLILSSNL